MHVPPGPENEAGRPNSYGQPQVYYDDDDTGDGGWRVVMMIVVNDYSFTRVLLLIFAWLRNYQARRRWKHSMKVEIKLNDDDLNHENYDADDDE